MPQRSDPNPTDPEPDAGGGGAPVTSALGFLDVEARSVPTDQDLTFWSVHSDPAVTAVLTRAFGREGRVKPVSAKLTKARLRKAIGLLERADPASPALSTWRNVAGWSWRGGGAVAVFDPDPESPNDHRHILALRTLVASGRHLVPDDVVQVIPAGHAHPLFERWQQRWNAMPGRSWGGDAGLRLWSIRGGSYPETDSERDAVLDDHVTLLGELLDASESLLVVVVDVSPSPEPPATLAAAVRGLTHFGTWSSPDQSPYLDFGHAYIAEVPLDARSLAQVLALDVVDVILTPPDLRWQYRPYEAGVDMQLPSADVVAAVARAHADRLPWGDELGDRAAHLLATTRAVLVGDPATHEDDVSSLERHCHRFQVPFAVLDRLGERTDALRRARSSVCMNSEECVLVTWSLAEAAAALSSGVATIGCAPDEAGRQAFSDAGADAVVAKLTDVLPSREWG